MRCTLLASLAVATALTAGSSAHAEGPPATEPEAVVRAEVAPDTAGETSESAAKEDRTVTAEAPEAASPPPSGYVFSPRLVGPAVGAQMPDTRILEAREPRGFLGTRSTHLAVGWTLLGTGVASGVAAGTLAWQASRLEPSAQGTRPSTLVHDDKSSQQAQDRADKRAMANVMAGAGLAFLATGGITLLTAPAPRVGPNTRVGAMMTPSGGYLGVTGKW